MSEIKQWFLMLSSREQILVALGGIALLVVLIWLAGIKPMITKNKALNNQLTSRATELQWMQDNALTIKQLRVINQRNGNQAAPANPSRLLDQALKQYNLKTSLQRMQGRETVNITLKKAPGDQVMRLLGAMETRHNLKIKSFEITPLTSPGMIDIDMTLGK